MQDSLTGKKHLVMRKKILLLMLGIVQFDKYEQKNEKRKKLSEKL
jgi:hypothetical protein